MNTRIQNPPRVVWVIGQGGLLGRNTVTHIPSELRVSHPLSWESPSVLKDLEEAVFRFGRQTAKRPWQIYWLAGRATARSSYRTVAPEMETFNHFVSLLAEELPLDEGSLVLASSAGALFDEQASGPIQDNSPISPTTPYANLCITREALAQQLTRSGLALLIARLTNVYGPSVQPKPSHGIISHLLHSCVSGKRVPIIDHPESTRDYMYAPDVGRALVDEAQRLHSGQHRTVLAASGEETSLKSVIDLVANVTGSTPCVEYMESSHNFASVKSRRFAPKAPIATTPLDVGLALTWRQIRRFPDAF